MTHQKHITAHGLGKNEGERERRKANGYNCFFQRKSLTDAHYEHDKAEIKKMLHEICFFFDRDESKKEMWGLCLTAHIILMKTVCSARSRSIYIY